MTLRYVAARSGIDPHAQREIAEATRAYRRAEAVADRRRRDLLVLVVRRVFEKRITKSEAARITGYTREHLTNLGKDEKWLAENGLAGLAESARAAVE